MLYSNILNYSEVFLKKHLHILCLVKLLPCFGFSVIIQMIQTDVALSQEKRNKIQGNQAKWLKHLSCIAKNLDLDKQHVNINKLRLQLYGL